eukprot:CAMPEP_0175199762 /NCGR_PEP_ID=MMETSP0093-20121207/9197_1 /TAXON_ID=311494 /ORGANISM="Alexandrium monilatum, Strain CCMP3105" /LENGTH=331 /DNA_ID=CAMNT_0016492771 /DNA_START=56 /DNA_END=1050 /DNA_ORIENTATION=-
MTPIVWRVLLLAIGASGLRRDAAADASAAEVTPAGKRAVRRHRTGKKVTRGPNGTSYVFVAGVPGTGLDYWKGALRRCADAQRCQAREFAFYSGLLLGEESQVNESWVKKDKQQSDRIVPMNLVSPDPKRQPDDVFYRAFAGKLAGDAVDPRLPLYGKLAQRNGDSLKVVVLTRSSEKELLAYNMKKFNLDAEEADERLAADIGTLASQVTALPVDSYRCMRFEDTVSLGGNLKPLVKLGDLRTKALALEAPPPDDQGQVRLQVLRRGALRVSARQRFSAEGARRAGQARAAVRPAGLHHDDGQRRVVDQLGQKDPVAPGVAAPRPLPAQD